MTKKKSDLIIEPSKQRTILYDVDMAVAGSGLCSTFAAIAAGRCGASTVVIERFGTLGGNIGPGMGKIYWHARHVSQGAYPTTSRSIRERLLPSGQHAIPGCAHSCWTAIL